MGTRHPKKEEFVTVLDRLPVSHVTGGYIYSAENTDFPIGVTLVNIAKGTLSSSPHRPMSKQSTIRYTIIAIEMLIDIYWLRIAVMLLVILVADCLLSQMLIGQLGYKGTDACKKVSQTLSQPRSARGRSLGFRGYFRGYVCNSTSFRGGPSRARAKLREVFVS